MNKRIIAAALALVTVLAGCGNGTASAYKDGTYTGNSSIIENEDGSGDGNGYGSVELTIEDGKITGCTFVIREENGTIKDENYCKDESSDRYNKAQKAVSAAQKYASQLVQNGQLEGIDAMSGATINYNIFVAAVNDALKQTK